MQEGWISIGKFGIPSKAEAYEKFSKRLVQGKNQKWKIWLKNLAAAV